MNNNTNSQRLHAIAAKSYSTLTEKEKEFFFQETVKASQKSKPKDKETIHQEALSLLAWYRCQIRRYNPEYSIRFAMPDPAFEFCPSIHEEARTFDELNRKS